jgi:hypothetical protein
MKLKLEIEPKQQTTMHRNLIATLEQVAKLPSLDAAEKVLRDNVSAQWWIVGRGGHHVFLSLKTNYEPIRCAMIVEVR